ncbi:MAG: AAA family ATPase, partial [Campylobacterota bacterium]
TAIVGENGSGKSNILELISDFGYYENPYSNKDYPSLFLDLLQITVYYNKYENKIFSYEKNLRLRTNNKSSVTIEKITNDSIQKAFLKPTPSHAQQEYLLLLDFLMNNNIDFPFDIPKIVRFGIDDDFYELLKPIENKSFDFYRCYSPFEEDQVKRLKIFHILMLLAYLKNYNIDFNIQASKNHDETILELEEYIEKSIKLKIRSFMQFPLEDFSLTASHYINIHKISNDFFKIYIEITKIKNNNDLLESKGKNVFNFDFYPTMSDGQYQLIYILSNIYSQIDQDTITLCIDEGENYFHPNWQKKYINYLYQFLKDNFSDKKIHLILTSHSPFILSDLPKENVIFLKEGKQVDVDIDTFGANIHTLLSHGFFMKDGLMGEFAKGKIDQVINYLNEKKSEVTDDKQAQNIISIIGEPLLKRQLQKMLDSKRELSNKEEIDTIKKQIEALEQKLKDKQEAEDDTK